MFGFLLASAVLIWTLATASIVGGADVRRAVSMEITPALTVSPETAVANQKVVLYGAGFTPAATSGGAGYQNGHQITDMGASNITVDGVLLTSANVPYPINFHSLGSWPAVITIPATPEIKAGGAITIKVTDDQGQTLSTQLTIKSLSISVDPASGSRHTIVRITGKGFPAPTISAKVQVTLSYAGLPWGVVSPSPTGKIDVWLPVPVTAGMDSVNQVRATREGYIYQFAT